ncbi:hypothetical protein CPC08DRAFT_760802 [Agrocybe pediades]|nr:hypothetical protein CPC08DRAFT_760802 [Agrocybe pediades]
MSKRNMQRVRILQAQKHEHDHRHTPSGLDNLNSSFEDRFWELGQATKIIVDQIRDLQARVMVEKHGLKILFYLMSSLGKPATNPVDGNVRRKTLSALTTSPHTIPRAGLKRSRSPINDSSEENEPCIPGDIFDDYRTPTRKRRRLSTSQSLSSPGARTCFANSRLSDDLPAYGSWTVSQPSSSHSLPSSTLTTYPNVRDDAYGQPPEYHELFIRPRSPDFFRKKRYFLDKYDREKQCWTLIRDWRSTDAGKLEAACLLEEGWRDCGTFQADLEDCARMTDTTFEFKAWAKYFDVPYSGDKNVLTPSDPDYPERLRNKSPPPPSSSSEKSDESWYGIQGLPGYDL